MRPEDTPRDGYCQCGCGQRTKLASQADPARGDVRGQPVRFVHGHNARRYHLDSYVVDDNGCWIWQGNLDQNGYAVYCEGSRGSSPIRVARLFYERAHGPLPTGYVPDHCCPGGANRACCNPAHLRPLTDSDNSRFKKSTKLDWDRVHEIRALAGTMTQREIAARFDVGETQINRVINHKRWRE